MHVVGRISAGAAPSVIRRPTFIARSLAESALDRLLVANLMHNFAQ
jgi:hypothetical protein